MKQTIFCLALLICGASSARAQVKNNYPGNQIPAAPDGLDQESSPLGSPAEEMRYRNAIRHEESEHREMVDRAEEVSKLSGELRDSFGRNRSLSRNDAKKLERLEKLARKIRSQAGGSDGDTGLEETPQGLEQAVARLGEMSDKLLKNARKTSRLTVSVIVIELSNEVSELARHIRTYVPR